MTLQKHPESLRTKGADPTWPQDLGNKLDLGAPHQHPSHIPWAPVGLLVVVGLVGKNRPLEAGVHGQQAHGKGLQHGVCAAEPLAGSGAPGRAEGSGAGHTHPGRTG